jgi:hypothetical protein
MGAEALCRVRYGDQVSDGKALLETTELLFRGAFRLKIPLREITALTSEAGELQVCFAGGLAAFELGPAADKWAAQIRNPRGLMDKLGVKAGQRVAVINLLDAAFLADLHARTSAVSKGHVEPGSDLVFYAADSIEALQRLSDLRESLDRKGAVWVVSLKGKAAQIKDTDVMAAAREAGLVDTKVVSFSDTHTALKLVIPVAKR